MPVRDVTVSQDEVVTSHGPAEGGVQATAETYSSGTRNLSLPTQAGTFCVTQSTSIPLWALFLQHREIRVTDVI